MSEENIFYLDVDEIHPDPEQPRKTFNDEEVEETAFTIIGQGQINPIEVNGGNKIVTGEIRWRAIKKAVELNPEMPELRKVKCVYWSGDQNQRFERQVIENLHHHALTEGDRDKAIVKLWQSGKYPTMKYLGGAVGLSENAISTILKANEVRSTLPETLAARVTNRNIIDSEGLKPKTREKILSAVVDDKIKSQDVRELRKIAQSSEELLEKTIAGEVSVKMAIGAAETLQKIEQRGVEFTPEQKQILANNLAQDGDILKKHEDNILYGVYRSAITPKRESTRVSEPIGRTSPVINIIKVKDEIKDNFRRYIGNCDMNERRWARKILVEIQTEVENILELVPDE